MPTLYRRNFLTTAGAAGAAPDTASTKPQPTILWLVSEDNSPYLGAYGDPLSTC